MENFSAKRLLVNVLFLLMAVFMVIAGINRLSSFVKASSIRVLNEKVADYPVYKEMRGCVFFTGLPINAPIGGRVEKFFGNFSYVEKGQVVGKIKGADYAVDLVSPQEGLLIWGNFESYYSSAEEIEKESSNDCNKFVLTGKEVGKGNVVCSVIGNDVFYVRLPLKAKQVYIYVGGFTVKGSAEYSGDGFSIYSLDQYEKYFVDKKSFMILEGIKKGIKVRDDVIISRKGVKGVYIVEGNIIRFVPVVSYPMEKNFRLITGKFGSENVILIATPRLVKDGEIFNE